MSENDMVASQGVSYDEFAGPYTPQKSASGSPAPQGQANNHSASRQRPQRTNNKARPKNVSISPEPSSLNQQTPPHTASLAKPASAAAFAGPSFHASPAPSALPMPSFYAKLNSESPSVRDNNSATQGSAPPANEGAPPTPVQNLVSSVAKESPLDALFRADRQEKEHARRASSANSFGAAMEPYSPFTQTLTDGSALPQSASLYSSRRNPVVTRSGGISATELDGTPGRPLGPAFSTPYSERIKASRSAAPAAPSQAQVTGQDDPSMDRSEALKKYLFGPKVRGPSRETSSSSQSRPDGNLSYQPGAPNANAKPNTEPGRPAEIRAMEDNLRRLLKLDSPTVSSTRSNERPSES
jgi:hypothetical protein